MHVNPTPAVQVDHRHNTSETATVISMLSILRPAFGFHAKQHCTPAIRTKYLGSLCMPCLNMDNNRIIGDGHLHAF
jgi:hypothetical protein